MKIQINKCEICVTVDTQNLDSYVNDRLKKRCDELEQQNSDLEQTVKELREMIKAVTAGQGERW